MRKLITLTIVVALLSVMLASPVTATQFDPKNPSWAMQRQCETQDNGDDDPLGVDKAGPTWIILKWTFPLFKIVIIEIIKPKNPDTIDGNHSAGNVSDNQTTARGQ